MNEIKRQEQQLMNPETFRSNLEQATAINNSLAKGEREIEGKSCFDNPKLNGVEKIATKHCDRAQEIAKASPDNGANFTDHGLAHWRETEKKSSEIADSVETAVASGKIYKDGYAPDDTRVPFAATIDRDILSGAALSHDTGMSDHGYSFKEENGVYAIVKQNPSDFDSVRSNHSLNSAINILVARDEYKALGYTDAQVDTMAAACFAHSKSSSGIKDMNSVSDWNEGFKRIDAVKNQYNKDHPDKQISFDCAGLTDNKERMSELASLSICLRPGDVSRDSGPNAETQSGETVHVEQISENPATNWKAEIDNFSVVRSDGQEITNEKSKQIHIGEQNIVYNETGINEDGRIQHTVTVADGNYAPHCTQKALEDHLGEFASAKDGQFVVAIEFDKPWDNETKNLYEKWRAKLEDKEVTGSIAKRYPNVDIYFPWDAQKG